MALAAVFFTDTRPINKPLKFSLSATFVIYTELQRELKGRTYFAWVNYFCLV